MLVKCPKYNYQLEKERKGRENEVNKLFVFNQAELYLLLDDA